MSKETPVEITSTGRTLVAAGTAITGSIESDVGVTVEGRLEGSVRAPTLAVARGAGIQGRIDVQDLRSSGELTGEVRAARARLSGRIGDGSVIRAESLEVQLGEGADADSGLVLGNCILEVGGEALDSPKHAKTGP